MRWNKLITTNISVLLLVLFYLLSRILFLNPLPIFFDSPEYIERLSNPDFLDALTSGHLPLHAGYILLLWPFYQFADNIHINPVSLTIYVQIIFSLVSIFSFYEITKALTNKDTALKAVVLISIIPLFWITNISIMMESVYIPFFLLCIYFMIVYARKGYCYFLILSLIFFSISFITHTVIVLWIPLLLFLIYYFNKSKIKPVTISLIFAIFAVSIINGYLISITAGSNLIDGINLLYASKFAEHSKIEINISGLIVLFRNFIIPMLRNNTNIMILFTVLGIIKSFKQNKKFAILLTLWILPSVIANQWWDSLFFGRHALIATFGIVLSTSLILKNNNRLGYFLVIYILITAIPAIMLLKGDIPYLQEASAIKKLPGNGLLIESHFARPQVDSQYKGKTIFVDEPGWNRDGLYDEIIKLLRLNKPVFVTAQALSEPYGLYSGPYLHSLSLSYKKDYVLKEIINKFTLKQFSKINNADNLVIYKISSTEHSSHPNVYNMKNHYRRLDYWDPVSRIWLKIIQ